jgi:broad specificity phosphatase PhoE
MMEFWLFRHGETDWNRAGRLQGRTEIPLNELGLAQVAELGEFLKPHANSFLWGVSSTLGRAQQTAKLALPKLRWSLDEGWVETKLGVAEGLTREEIVTQLGSEAWEQWADLSHNSWSSAFVGGESRAQVRDRSLRALESLRIEVQEHLVANADRGRGTSSPRVAISTHGGLLRRLIMHFLPHEAARISVPNAALFVLHWDARSGWRAEAEPRFVPTKKT